MPMVKGKVKYRNRVSLIECIPNISEGRRHDVIARLVAVADSTPGVRLLDSSSDASHNRSVLTLAGAAGPLQEAVLAIFEVAMTSIDLRLHTGEHPRLGAVDVVPFVPLDGATMAECVALARTTAAEVARRFGLPIFLYGESATTPARRRLEDIRRGGFEGLTAKMASAAWRPDFGPSAPHVSAGASVIGARGPLIAYNVNLDTDRLDIAKAIAASIRESGGGLPHVKAIGVALADRGIVQVSTNLTNYRITSVADVFETVTREARRHGVQVLESEINGLAPEAALATTSARALRLTRSSVDQLLEARLRSSTNATPERRRHGSQLSSGSARGGAMPNPRILRYRLLRSMPSISAVREMFPC